MGTTDTGVKAAGAKGEAGEKGDKGDAGRGIASITAEAGNKLVITYTDGTTQTISIGSTVVSEDNNDFTYELLSNGTYTITGLANTSLVDIVIPSRYNGTFVTRIAAEAFKNNTNIKSVRIHDGITQIGNSAFEGCIVLKDVSISSDSELKKIGSRAFYGCVAMNSIYVPETVTFIGSYAFYSSGLKTATFAATSGWNLYGKFNGYQAHLNPTNAANAAKALSTNYTSHTASDFYKQNWERNINLTLTYGYDREL
ncbi:MAG TPA: hypothetical protein DD628_02630 [Clostridiales bacterium]|nr:hypothetical protein [Candidatus Apopatosoma intestinale]